MYVLVLFYLPGLCSVSLTMIPTKKVCALIGLFDTLPFFHFDFFSVLISLNIPFFLLVFHLLIITAPLDTL